MVQNEWHQWLEQQIGKRLGDFPRRLLEMHRRYKLSDKPCGECWYLEGIRHHNHTYYKCRAYGISHSTATDWRKKWPGCGLHRTEPPVIKCLSCGHKRSADTIAIPGMLYTCVNCGKFDAIAEMDNE